jgi:HEAT repeat protein
MDGDRNQNKNMMFPLEEEKVRINLLEQIKVEEADNLVHQELFDLIGAPTEEDGSKNMVEVEYLGRLGYVDISFENPQSELGEREYDSLINAIEILAFDPNVATAKEACRVIESFGDHAIDIMFRECRKIDLTDERKRRETLHLMSRLTMSSLKGRRIIKAVLENGTSQQHIRLAILLAGILQDRELVGIIAKHARNPDFFEVASETLFRIHAPLSIKPLITLLHTLDANRRDLMDVAYRLVPQFHKFGQDAIEEIFEAYLECRPQIRPVFLVALRSFKGDVIPKLERVLKVEENEGRLIRISKALGELQHPYAIKLLVDEFNTQPHKRVYIIEGFSHTKDPSLVPLLLKELEESSDAELKRKCLTALSYLGDSTLIPVVRTFLVHSETKNDAMYALVRFGDNDAFELFFKAMITEGSESQKIIKYVSRLPFQILRQMASRISSLTDGESLTVVSALRRPNILPREIGPVLQKKLGDRNVNQRLKIEIYRLIGKHVNSKHELLSQSILYSAKKVETDPTILREIDAIISHMKKEKGLVSASR